MGACAGPLAVQALYPGTQVTIGPAIDDGFLLRLCPRRTLHAPKTCPRSKREMRKIIKGGPFPTRREVWPRGCRCRAFQGHRRGPTRPETDPVHSGWRGCPRSIGTATGHDLWPAGRIFRTTAEIGDAFQADQGRRPPIGGAISKNAQLQRIYGTAWRDKKEAGRISPPAGRSREARPSQTGPRNWSCSPFSPDVGAGLPLWMPNGMVIRQELEFLALQEERKEGYRRVATPHITKEALLLIVRATCPITPKGMYAPLDIDGENYYLRPMKLPASSPDLSGDAAIRTANCRCGIAEYGQGLSL